MRKVFSKHATLSIHAYYRGYMLLRTYIRNSQHMARHFGAETKKLCQQDKEAIEKFMSVIRQIIFCM